MAIISDDYTPLKLFPTIVAEYKIDFTPEEDEVLRKYSNDQFIEENNANDDGPEKNFRLAWLKDNIVGTRPEFDSLNRTLCELSFHFLRNVWNQNTHEDMGLSIVDSWIVKIGGDSNLEEPLTFRSHNHAHALLTGVVYLDDSSHGTNIKDQLYAYPYYPFVWDPLVDDKWRKNEYVSESIRGKVLIMPAKTHHELIQSPDESDFRSTLIFNIWPCGTISAQGGSHLNQASFDKNYKLSDFVN